jgi:23S rRNA (adenine2503-C2)-methyltransferase
MAKDIRNLSYEELGEWLVSIKQPKYRSQQIFAWLYQKRILDFRGMKNLPNSLINSMQDSFQLNQLEVKQKQISKIDGTVKYLFELNDGEYIETVVIPAGDRTTICMSTQVGCRFKCKFCASGLFGFRRNLSLAEILSQLIIVLNDKYNITNIVFMGTGEPLDNLENVKKAIKVINDKHGFNIGARRITVSTSGIPEKIKELSDLGLQIELSISLHASDNEKRDLLMPINKLYPLESLMSSAKEYYEKTNRLITFEYILLRNVNDTQEDADNLVKLLSGLKCKVNLIPFSPVKELPYQTPDKQNVIDFQNVLDEAGITTTIRTSKGSDISAACGQLRIQNQ